MRSITNKKHDYNHKMWSTKFNEQAVNKLDLKGALDEEEKNINWVIFMVKP